MVDVGRVEYRKVERGLEARCPRLPAEKVLAIRMAVSCTGVSELAQCTLFRFPEDQKEKFEAALRRPLPEPPLPVQILLYYDFNSPYGYAATAIAQRLEQSYQVRVDWRGFELFPEWRPFPSRSPEEVRKGFEAAKAVGEPLGLPFGADRPPYIRTRLLHLACEYAKLAGRFHALNHALFRALWVERRDLTDFNTVKQVAYEAGLDAMGLENAVLSGRLDGLLAEHRRNAEKAGVFGVPTFIVDGQQVWGREPYDDLVEAFSQRGIPKRA